MFEVFESVIKGGYLITMHKIKNHKLNKTRHNWDYLGTPKNILFLCFAALIQIIFKKIL